MKPTTRAYSLLVHHEQCSILASSEAVALKGDLSTDEEE
jgi:hypothetical protein